MMRIILAIHIFLCLSGALSAEILKHPPVKPNLESRYLFYLHGSIVEGSDGRPHSKKYGFYEYHKITQGLSKEGFTVISEIRAQGTQVGKYALKISEWVNKLKEKGVPSRSISVVGASKGGVIARHVSALQGDEELNYVILAGLFEAHLKQKNTPALSGRVLSIHDSSDQLKIIPEPYFKRGKALSAHSSVVTNLEVGHGLLYQPYPEWIEPLLAWLKPSDRGAARVFFDQSRGRKIPSRIYQPDGKANKLAIISTGYGVLEHEYSYLSDFLTNRGYLAICSRHTLSSDEPIPTKGNLYQGRLPFWQRGVRNIDFIISEVRKDYPGIDLSQTFLVGHSNGGDISALYASLGLEKVAAIMTLDHRRVPIPRKNFPQFLSVRGDELDADKGVLPDAKERTRYGIQAIQLEDTKHADFSDSGNPVTRQKVVKLLGEFLTL